ncbi:MAG: Gldg family protein [Deltaproteobacteria bacterium]|nr:Gldg family protein [Deltaproteobacteria bacterium]
MDLHGGEEEIPADNKGLIIMGPARRIEERELRRINSYLMRGGSVAIFAGGTNITGADTRPTAARAEHNLNALLEGYGVTINPDVILDYQASDSIQEIEQGPGAHPDVHLPRPRGAA